MPCHLERPLQCTTISSRPQGASGPPVTEFGYGPDFQHRVLLLTTHRADGLLEAEGGDKLHANARAQDLEFIGTYYNKGHWYAKVDSLNGVSHHVGPFETDVVAAIQHDVLATALHGFSYELNYPEESYAPKSIFTGFVLCEYDSCLLIRKKPRMRRSFQFGTIIPTASDLNSSK